MFETETISKIITILAYIGLFISSITGFMSLSSSYNGSVMMTSIVILLSSLLLTVIIEFYNLFNLTQKQIYYARSVILLHYSLLAMGISDIGVGFGICGILISLGNLFGGVFESDDDINHYVRAVDNEHEHK